MFNFVKDRMEARKHDGELDSGDVVQTVILIAGFVIVAVVVVVWLGTAIFNKGADAGACIEGASSYAGNNTSTAAACKANHASGNSFKSDATYDSRY